ncbi:hypothetical protein [Catellatospora sichuanensis]|uniref:hypothetical protein n=1 Tax=Catellatospora sichuanensis TaxID=1969805 RepID=UPI001642A9CA|nr:hypothetical protein [Catellatospora sichuanensis]
MPVGRRLGEQLEDGAPVATADERAAHRLADDKAIEVAVFEIDCGLFGSVRDEPDFDLAGVFRLVSRHGTEDGSDLDRPT